jgi:hypothetical protein
MNLLLWAGFWGESGVGRRVSGFGGRETGGGRYELKGIKQTFENEFVIGAVQTCIKFAKSTKNRIIHIILATQSLQ